MQETLHLVCHRPTGAERVLATITPVITVVTFTFVAVVFAGRDATLLAIVIGLALIMVAGALLISLAALSTEEAILDGRSLLVRTTLGSKTRSRSYLLAPDAHALVRGVSSFSVGSDPARSTAVVLRAADGERIYLARGSSIRVKEEVAIAINRYLRQQS